VTLGLLVLGAGIVVLGIWVEEGLPLGRAMGVTLIAFAAFAVTVPVLHWIDRGVVAVARATSDAVRFCPHCGAKLSGDPGVEVACSRCGRGFTVAPSAST
jgi:ribosomal protein S27AE